jgi:hypothetical protein
VTDLAGEHHGGHVDPGEQVAPVLHHVVEEQPCPPDGGQREVLVVHPGEVVRRMPLVSIETRKACRVSRSSTATARTNPSAPGKSRMAPAAAPSAASIQGRTTSTRLVDDDVTCRPVGSTPWQGSGPPWRGWTARSNRGTGPARPPGGRFRPARNGRDVGAARPLRPPAPDPRRGADDRRPAGRAPVPAGGRPGRPADPHAAGLPRCRGQRPGHRAGAPCPQHHAVLPPPAHRPADRSRPGRRPHSADAPPRPGPARRRRTAPAWRMTGRDGAGGLSRGPGRRLGSRRAGTATGAALPARFRALHRAARRPAPRTRSSSV